MQFQAEAQVSEGSLVGAALSGCPFGVLRAGGAALPAPSAPSWPSHPRDGAQIPAALTLLLSLQGSGG